MHPDLSSHLHTAECNEFIKQLRDCHKEHPFLRFAGWCNQQDTKVGHCLSKELNRKRKEAGEKMKRKREIIMQKD